MREKQIVRLYQKNLSVRQVARRIGISPITVSRTLKRCGVKARAFCNQGKYSCDEHYFDEIDTEEKAYWLGFLLADGCIRTNSNMLSVNLSSVDIGHLNKLRKCLKSNNRLYYQKGGTCGLSCLTISSKPLTKSLAAKGIVAHKKWPYKVLPKLRKHFWRGVVDGDGCISLTYNKNTPQISVSLVGTRETIDLFYEFCCTIVETKAQPERDYRGNQTDNFRLHGPKALKVCEVLYDGAKVFLVRKRAKYKKYKTISDRYRSSERYLNCTKKKHEQNT